MHIENRFKELLKLKAQSENRKLPRRLISEETGISLTSVQNWATNNVSQFQQEQIIAFCKFFDCTIDELLVIVGDDEEDSHLVAVA